MKNLTKEEYHKEILELLWSISLADHLGDVGDSMTLLLRDIGEEELADADWECYRKGKDGEYTSELHELLRERGFGS